MKNRTTNPETIGLEAWLEKSRIVLPLRVIYTENHDETGKLLGWAATSIEKSL